MHNIERGTGNGLVAWGWEVSGVALHRILVIDDSLAVRETIGILLGADYEVQASTVEDYPSIGLATPPD